MPREQRGPRLLDHKIRRTATCSPTAHSSPPLVTTLSRTGGETAELKPSNTGPVRQNHRNDQRHTKITPSHLLNDTSPSTDISRPNVRRCSGSRCRYHTPHRAPGKITSGANQNATPATAKTPPQPTVPRRRPTKSQQGHRRKLCGSPTCFPP